MRVYDIIAKKRDGLELSIEEISFFIHGYTQGIIPDYQASALLMALFLRGMNERETADLTDSMAHSGEIVDLSAIPGVKVDKHSTGGVGDKTTLIVAPLVAACGVPVAKMSGRGLGHTGGTIDKLEAIPGFRTALTITEFLENVREIGISLAGQTGNLAPADKKLYALRDVTATVDCIPLIASSIMSKKIASGADGIVLDVKTGSGAFMKTLEGSLELARAMVKIGEKVNRKTAAVITDMDMPLGNAVGNSLEVIEAIETLKGNGPKDLEEICLALSSKMLEVARVGTPDQCSRLVSESLHSGKALRKFEQLICRQGGDPKVLEDYSLFGKALNEEQVYADMDGYIFSVKTDSLGTASMILGAGRETKESSIDYTAGLVLHKKTGDRIEKGEKLATLYSNQKNRIAEAKEIVRISLFISDERPARRPLILASVDSQNVK